MKEIELTQGKVALIDDEDYALISRYSWSFSRYAKAHIGKVDGKYRREYMHTLILGKKFGYEIDHIDGNKLNNQKENLRFVTRSQNIRNNMVRKSSKSGYKGVTFNKQTGRWRADIAIGGKQVFIGRFDSKEEAAKAWNKVASENYGDHARLNSFSC